MRPTIEYRHGNDPERDDLESALSAIDYFEPTQTIQDAPDTDINVLVKRFGITDGSILPGRQLGVDDPKYYGEWDDSLTHRQVLDMNRDANERFAQLPAELRSKFQNDPGRLWAWINDPDNVDEAVTLGLLKRKDPPEPRGPAPTPPPPASAGE